VIKSESDVEREKTVRFVRESMSNHLNDEQSAIVVIMQRLHEGDVSGTGFSRPHQRHHVGNGCQTLDHRKDMSHPCVEGGALREVSFRTCRPSRRAPH
jgi:hypothetical protein